MEEFLNAFSETFGFSEDCLNQGEYNGTIFWFPLRDTPSELSGTCYTGSKVLDLFKSFRSEAVHSLLFLKSLCKAELFCRGSNSEYDFENGEPFLTVELEDTGIRDSNCQVRTDSNLQNERKTFLDSVKLACEKVSSGGVPSEDIVYVAHPTFKTRYKTTQMSEVDEKVSNWVVINVYKGESMSDKLRKLINDKDLSYMPYVGAAVPLSNNEETLKGHIFCFLPLPQEKRSLTGLPVHFNGFFALSQNRRHLKWASDDQEKMNMHRDKSIEWNECLVNEVLPGVYIRLIKEMINISINNNNAEGAVDAVYRCIPDEALVDNKWEGCLKELHKQLTLTNFIFVPKSSKWVPPNQPLYTMFDDQNTTAAQEETVIKLLKSYKGVDVTQVPKHIWTLLKGRASPRNITPSDLCKILQSEDTYKEVIDYDEKLKLLEYITKDMQKEGKYELLSGLELIPLMNGEFVAFNDEGYGKNSVYYYTAEQIEIFPGLESRLVSRKITKSLEEILQNLACIGKFKQ